MEIIRLHRLWQTFFQLRYLFFWFICHLDILACLGELCEFEITNLSETCKNVIFVDFLKSPRILRSKWLRVNIILILETFVNKTHAVSHQRIPDENLASRITIPVLSFEYSKTMCLIKTKWKRCLQLRLMSLHASSGQTIRSEQHNLALSNFKAIWIG